MPGPVRPYGSLYARVTLTPAGGTASRLSLDCVSAKVSVAGGAPPAYSELGDQAGGDQGRYVLAPYPLDPFATAYLEPSVTPRVTPTPTATATATAVPSVAPTAAPTAVPTATATPTPVIAAGKAAVASTKLKVASSRVAVSVRCTGETACRGTVRLRTASKVRVGKRSKVVTLTSSKAYSLAAGTSASVKLTLSKDGRSVLKARRSLKVTVELRPADGKVAVRQLTLRR